MVISPWSVDASSEHMSTMDTTDSEKSPIRVVQNGLQTSGSGSHSSQLAAVGGSYSSLSPMIIMNNVLLKQVHCCHTANSNLNLSFDINGRMNDLFPGRQW